MAFLDATDKIDNSNPSHLGIVGKSNLHIDKDGNLFVNHGKWQVVMIGNFNINSHGNVAGGKLHEIDVNKDGDQVYKIADLSVKIIDFLNAEYGGTLDKFIPKLFGGNDKVWGSFDDDQLYGFDGRDDINGFGGNDVIHGGTGNDTLRGDTGNDAFVFDTKLNPNTNVDTITDWDFLKHYGGGTDSIWLDANIFDAFQGKEGHHLGSKYFVVGNRAETANQHIIYNYDKGKLFYDDDGKGGDGKVLFARLDGNHHLHHGDFLIV